MTMAVRRSGTSKRRSPNASLNSRNVPVVSTLGRRDEGEGGGDGIVLDMTMVGDGLFNVIYSVPVQVGTNNDVFFLQVDTGSADFWIASTSCSSAPCTSNRPKLYDPSVSSRPTDVDFDIQYLSGSVAGPIVWDDVSLGGYAIAHQALAAATTVVNQTLSSQFSGILGLALPFDSVILQRIPAGTSSDPDGAPFTSNLYGITPTENRPPQFFYSVALERPGSSKIPSVLGIGRHPSGVVDDPSKILYSTLVQERTGATHWWKSQLRAITVYVDGQEVSVDLGRSTSGAATNVAILDTGVPYIIARTGIANAIWGAVGVSPSDDGSYYLPCTTPLNITITLDDRPPITIHPLDLTAYPSGDRSNPTCVGLIQSNRALDGAGGVGDIVLGVPFLRNVYTVMAYHEPAADGSVPAPGTEDIDPRLGLMGLTDVDTAKKEFEDVRLFNRPIDGGTVDNDARHASGGRHGLPVGVIVLLGLLGFVALCAAIFFARWWYMKRKYRSLDDGSVQEHETPREGGADRKEVHNLALGLGLGESSYHLAPWKSDVPTVDSQRTLAGVYVGGKGEKGRDSDAESDANATPRSLSFKLEGYDSQRTRVDVTEAETEGETDDDAWDGKEVGLKRPKTVIRDEDWDPRTSWVECYAPGSTPMLGEWRPEDNEDHATMALSMPIPRTSLSSSTRRGTESVDLTSAPMSALAVAAANATGPKVTTPLLRMSRSEDSGSDSEADAQHSHQHGHSDDDAEFGVVAGGGGMAGVGTAKRGSVIDEKLTLEMKRKSMKSGSSSLGGVGSIIDPRKLSGSTSSSNLAASSSTSPAASGSGSSSTRPSPPSSFPSSLGGRPSSIANTNATEMGFRPRALRVNTEPIRRSALSQVYTVDNDFLTAGLKPDSDPARMSR